MPWDALLESEPLRKALTAAAILLAALVVSSVLRRLVRRLPGGASRPVDASPDAGAGGPTATVRAPSHAERVVTWTVLLTGVVLAFLALDIDATRLLDHNILTVQKTPVTVGDVVNAIGVMFAAWVVSQVVRKVMRSWIRADDPQAHANVRALARLVHYIVMLLGAAVALQTLNIPIGAFLAVGGVFVVALGFAMKELTENFVSGVILLAERAIKPGDVLEVEGTVVRVSQMGIRTTMATTRDGEDLIIPNAKLVTSTVKNLTYRDTLHRIHVVVGVAYESDVPQVMTVLAAAGEGLSWRNADTPPEVYLIAFGANSIDFDVVIWTADPWRSRRAVSDLHEAVWRALHDAGITIAFPQMDVHMDVVRGKRAARDDSGASEGPD